jgi:hypothetical protein
MIKYDNLKYKKYDLSRIEKVSDYQTLNGSATNLLHGSAASNLSSKTKKK